MIRFALLEKLPPSQERLQVTSSSKAGPAHSSFDNGGTATHGALEATLGGRRRSFRVYGNNLWRMVVGALVVLVVVLWRLGNEDGSSSMKPSLEKAVPWLRLPTDVSEIFPVRWARRDDAGTAVVVPAMPTPSKRDARGSNDDSDPGTTAVGATLDLEHGDGENASEASGAQWLKVILNPSAGNGVGGIDRSDREGRDRRDHAFSHGDLAHGIGRGMDRQTTFDTNGSVPDLAAGEDTEEGIEVVSSIEMPSDAASMNSCLPDETMIEELLGTSRVFPRNNFEKSADGTSCGDAEDKGVMRGDDYQRTRADVALSQSEEDSPGVEDGTRELLLWDGVDETSEPGEFFGVDLVVEEAFEVRVSEGTGGDGDVLTTQKDFKGVESFVTSEEIANDPAEKDKSASMTEGDDLALPIYDGVEGKDGSLAAEGDLLSASAPEPPKVSGLLTGRACLSLVSRFRFGYSWCSSIWSSKRRVSVMMSL